MALRKSPSLTLTSGSSGLAPRRWEHYREAALKEQALPGALGSQGNVEALGCWWVSPSSIT